MMLVNMVFRSVLYMIDVTVYGILFCKFLKIFVFESSC